MWVEDRLPSKENTMQFLFWLSLGIVFYTFFGYGALITLLAWLKPKKAIPELMEEDLPEVTLLIAAYNEEAIICEKLRNSLNLDYPADKLKIAVVTDGSDDKTPDMVRQFETVNLFHQPARKGKIAAVNRIMPLIDSPITVFTDANVMINPEGLKLMVRHFQSNLVAAVSGEKRIVVRDQDAVSAKGEGLYWRYESFLKQKDAAWNSLVGAAGELFAIRTHLFEPVANNTIIEDFMITMGLVTSGYKVAYEPKATASELASANTKEEMKRKVRIAAGGIQAVFKLARLLNPIRYGKLCFQYVSHRVLRWTLMPLSLLVALISAAWQYDTHWFFQWALLLQIAFYGAAIVGFFKRHQAEKSKLFQVPYYFTFMHVCVIRGWIRYASGNQKVTWERAVRMAA